MPRWRIVGIAHRLRPHKQRFIVIVTRLGSTLGRRAVTQFFHMSGHAVYFYTLVRNNARHPTFPILRVAPCPWRSHPNAITRTIWIPNCRCFTRRALPLPRPLRLVLPPIHSSHAHLVSV